MAGRKEEIRKETRKKKVEERKKKVKKEEESERKEEESERRNEKESKRVKARKEGIPKYQVDDQRCPFEREMRPRKKMYAIMYCSRSKGQQPQESESERERRK